MGTMLLELVDPDPLQIKSPGTTRGAGAPLVQVQNRLFTDLFFLDFRQRFAIDAQVGRRSGFQSAQTDLYTA
jgi:hypothetical protein